MKKSIRVAIIDDEPVSITMMELNLKKYEKESGDKFEITKYDGGQKFICDFKNQYDIILLDIMMPIVNGLEAAEFVRKRDEKVIILFITAVDRYMSEGYSLNIFNYIVKPVQYVKFKDTINRAVNKIAEAGDESIVIKNDAGLFRIYIGEIRYIETYDRKLSIHRGNGSIICHKTMKEIEEVLSNYHFYRCHSGYLVNLSYVREVIGNAVILVTGEEIPVSQNKKSGFVTAISEYAGKVF